MFISISPLLIIVLNIYKSGDTCYGKLRKLSADHALIYIALFTVVKIETWNFNGVGRFIGFMKHNIKT